MAITLDVFFLVPLLVAGVEVFLSLSPPPLVGWLV